jgi:hypothetical protein
MFLSLEEKGREEGEGKLEELCKFHCKIEKLPKNSNYF